MKKTKNKDYLTLANERHEQAKIDKANKIALEYDKLEYKRYKDKRSQIIGLIWTIPVILLILIFSIVFIVLMCKK